VIVNGWHGSVEPMLAGCGCSHKPQYLLAQYTQPVERRCFFSVVSQMLLLHFEEHWIIKSLHWPLMLHRTRMRFDRVRSCHLTILRSRISCCNESVTFRSSLNSTSSVTFISVDWKRSRRKYGGKRSTARLASASTISAFALMYSEVGWGVARRPYHFQESQQV
jgi:hypothetical protein